MKIVFSSTTSAIEQQSNIPSICSVTGTIVVGIVCLVSTLGLVIGAFDAVPDATVGMLDDSCDTSATSSQSEALLTLVVFSFGYLSSLIAKRRHDIARRCDKMLCWAIEAMQLTFSHTTCAWRTVARLRNEIRKGAIAIVFASLSCIGCVTTLVVSAFLVQPDSDSAADDTSDLPPGSELTRGLILGVMVIMAFRIRTEFLGLVGSGCLLQPW
jgi:hypothetical protein